MYDTSPSPFKKQLGLKTIIIDLDDVLVDYKPLYATALMSLMPEVCANWDDVKHWSFDTYRYCGLRGRTLVERLRQDGYVVSDRVCERLLDKKMELTQEFVMYDETIERKLRTLANYTAIYLASNRSQRVVMDALEKMKILSCFTGILTPERYGKKEDGEMYEAIDMMCGVDKHEIVVIEGDEKFCDSAKEHGYKYSIRTEKDDLPRVLTLLMDLLNVQEREKKVSQILNKDVDMEKA